ncbi:MAG: hypothetical protein KJ000_10955 [Pirellulaceae bacterium]|nr:hypothetical protein [Pirellulaceae bacterium]
MIRWINIILVLAALYGAYLAVSEEQLRRELSVQHRTLAAETGYLDITDPDKVHVVALPSEDPLHFRWRIYLPANYEAMWQTNNWGEDGNTSTGPAENFIAQVRFRENESGYVMVFRDMKIGGVGSVGGPELQTLLSGKWDQIERVQLGANGPVVVEPDEVATLLQLRMPESMASEAESVLPEAWGRNYVPVVYEVRFGTKEAWEAAGDATSISGARGR